jgi:acyl-coenzyme A thioesterase PaaI-like protein
LKTGSVICFVEATILDHQDRLIATASSSYLLKDRPD